MEAQVPVASLLQSEDLEPSLKTIYARAGHAADKIRTQLPPALHKPAIAIVCGSGLGGLQEAIQSSTTHPKTVIPSEKIPYFPQSTVEGHEGKLVFGVFGSSQAKTGIVPAVLLVGRTHFFEGHSMEAITFATRVFKRLGVETLIVTNAAGGLNPDYDVGDIVIMNDHVGLVSLVGNHPLRGLNEHEFGVRFPAMSDAYDLGLRRRAHQVWKRLPREGLSNRLHEGIYWHLSGPSYETRAECRLLRSMGADVVGMSTVPEVIVARHSGMRVLAMSLVTNNVVIEAGPRGDDPAIQHLTTAELAELQAKGSANHEEVLLAGKAAAKIMQSFISEIIQDLEL